VGRIKRARSGLKSAGGTAGTEGSRGEKKRSARRRSNDAGSSDALDEVNRILDKIGEQGMDSLTPAELEFLNDMSQKKSGPERKH
jgi:hypothetical protein